MNNGYTNSSFDSALNKYLEKKQLPPTPNNSDNPDEDGPQIHKVYYKNQFSSAYKTDERIMQDIIKNNVKCTNVDEKLKLVTYY